jgi:hypothetical protein
MRTVPVNHSLGPFAEGFEPPLVIFMLGSCGVQATAIAVICKNRIGARG